MKRMQGLAMLTGPALIPLPAVYLIGGTQAVIGSLIGMVSALSLLGMGYWLSGVMARGWRLLRS